MSMMSISQSAMLTDAVHDVRRSPVSFQSQPSRFVPERMSSERAMCTMHMTDKAMYAAMAMSMAAASATDFMLVKTDVHTSVSLFAADLFSVAFIAFVVLLVVSLLLGSLVVLISLITLLLTCLTGQKKLERLVGLIKRTVELASIRIHSIQGE